MRSQTLMPTGRPLSSLAGTTPVFRIPALAVTNSGRIILACDQRPSFHDLPGDISIVYRASDDGGTTWSDPTYIIASDDGWGFGDPSLVTQSNGEILCFYVASRGLSFWDNGGIKSGNWGLRVARGDGQTWEHRDLTSDLLGDHPEISSAFFSSGNGLETSTGRIINPVVWHGTGERVPHVSMALSDDGQSWHLSQPIPGQCDETKVLEVGDDRLAASIRGYPDRLVSYSSDWGETWSTPSPTCRDVGCNAGLAMWQGQVALTLPQPHLESGSPPVTLGDPSGGRSLATLQDWSARTNLCLLTGPDPDHLELDRVIDPGAAAYSAVATLPNGDLAVAWEADSYREIRFATIPGPRT